MKKGWIYLCSHLCCLHTAIHISSLCGFWHCHPYIPIHFWKMFFILYDKAVEQNTIACLSIIDSIQFLIKQGG